MTDISVDDRLRERDELGIVTERRAIRRKYAAAVAKRVEIEMGGPAIRAAISRAVNAGLRAEVERIVAARLEQQAKEIAAIKTYDGPPLKDILETVATVTGVSVGDLCGPCRMRRLAWPRHLGFHLVKRTRPDLSLPQIGKAFGSRDHTTIMHGLKKVALLADQPPFNEWLMHPAIHALLSWKGDEE
jgi:chromosomal replication initiation ATPase DnaA